MTQLRERRVAVRPNGLPVSWRVSPLVVLAVAVVAALAVAVGMVSMSLGSFPISVTDVARAVLGIGEADAQHAFVVRDLRLPRVLTAALAGIAFAGSGALFQGLVRNPLVAPDIVGVDAGAAVAAVWWIVTGQPSALLPIAAFAGALAAAAALHLLTWRGGLAPGRLVLVGIGLHAGLTAVVTLLLVRFPIEQVSSAILWQTGTLHGAGWRQVAGLTAGLVILVPVGLALCRRLQALALGDDAGRALGLRAEATRTGVLVAGAGLAAVAVAAGGPITFVALVSPHIAKLIAGPLTAGVLVLAGAVGALLLLASDLVAQHALPVDVPVGVVTAAVGAPYFLFLLYRTNASA